MLPYFLLRQEVRLMMCSSSVLMYRELPSRCYLYLEGTLPPPPHRLHRVHPDTKMKRYLRCCHIFWKLLQIILCALSLHTSSRVEIKHGRKSNQQLRLRITTTRVTRRGKYGWKRKNRSRSKASTSSEEHGHAALLVKPDRSSLLMRWPEMTAAE